MKRIKIKYKIALLSISLIVIFGSLITYIDAIKDYKAGISNYKITGLEIIKNLEYQIAHFIYINDYVELQRITNTIKENNVDVKYFFVLDANNNLMVHSFNENFPNALLKVNNKKTQDIVLLDIWDQSVYDFSYPIKESKLGTIRMGITSERLIRQLQSEIISKIGILLVFILIATFVSLLISNLISKPVNKLLELVNKVSKGNFEQAISVETGDEIGLLANAFNQMCIDLKKLTGNLESTIDELDEKKMEYEALYEEYFNQNQELSLNMEEMQIINIQLEKAKEKAEEYDRLKTAFLANLSHEIRTPMNGIMGFAEMLKSPGLSEAKQKKYAEVIEKSGERMLNIINNLVNISKIEVGQVELVKKKTDINSIIDELYVFFKPNTDSKNIKLSRKKDMKLKNIEIELDRDKIMQVFTNLIGNALKFTDNGQIDFGYFSEDIGIKFFVKDTGIGIPNNMLNSIFDRFIQVGHYNNRNVDGSGLGLSISKAFIEMHGGKIWVESEVDVGSTFYFTIPFNSKKGNIDVENFEIKNGLSTNVIASDMKILIAEDDNSSSFLLKEILCDIKIEPIFVKNGYEAINVVENIGKIDLVILDIKMPKMDGFEAALKIKETKPNIPIIIQSAFSGIENQIKAFEIGCAEFVSKPIKREELIELILKYAPVH